MKTLMMAFALLTLACSSPTSPEIAKADALNAGGDAAEVGEYVPPCDGLSIPPGYDKCIIIVRFGG